MVELQCATRPQRGHGPRPLRRALVAAAAVAVVAAGSTYAFATPDRGLGGRDSAVAGLIVYGYSYGPRCPGAGLADVVDRWGMYACNCTSFVAWALSANRQRTDWFVRGAMDAWNWPHVARVAGLAVDSTPSRGSVVVWPKVAPPFGHVAYVTGVERDGTIDVAEYNYPVLGRDTYVFDTRFAVRSRDAVFIHPSVRVSRRGRGGPLR